MQLPTTPVSGMIFYCSVYTSGTANFYRYENQIQKI
jgi:hypothetical protein